MVEVRRASDYPVQVSCNPVFALDLPTHLGGLRLLRENANSKARVKEQAEIFHDSNSSGTISSLPYSLGPTFSKVPFTADLPVEVLPTALHILFQIQYHLAS